MILLSMHRLGFRRLSIPYLQTNAIRFGTMHCQEAAATKIIQYSFLVLLNLFSWLLFSEKEV